MIKSNHLPVAILISVVVAACSASGSADSSAGNSPNPTPTESPTPTPPLTGTVTISLPGDPTCAGGMNLEVPKGLADLTAKTTVSLGEGLSADKASVALYQGDTQIGNYSLESIENVPLVEEFTLRAVLMYEGTKLAEFKCERSIAFADPRIQITTGCESYTARETVGVPFNAVAFNVVEPGWTVAAELNGKRIGAPKEIKVLADGYTSPAMQVSLGSKTLAPGTRKIAWKLINPNGKVVQTESCKSVIKQEKYADVSLTSSRGRICLSYSANYRVWVTLKVKNSGNIASDIIYIRVQSLDGYAIPNWVRGSNVSTAEDRGGGLWAEVMIKGERVPAKSSKTFSFAVDFYYNPDLVNVNVFNGKPSYDLYVSGQFADDSFQAPSYVSSFG